MPALTKLFEPITIGALTLKNRVVMAPITTLFDHERGARHTEFFAERARGGVGMITINLEALYPGRAGASGVVPDASVAEKGGLTVNHDAYVPRLRRLTGAIRAHGCRACVQLAVYGFWAKGGYGTPAEELSPSGIRLEGPAFRPDLERVSFVGQGRPATAEELHRIQQEIARAAVRAAESGFDMIQLQMLSGNLISRFLSPLTNVRTDRYGGPLENRARMALETIRAIKAAVGPGVPVSCRINGDDLLPGGMSPDDYVPLVPMLEDAGVDALDLKPGWYETRRPVNQMSVPRGAFVYVSETIRRVARVPVSANIRITDPELAERILREGRADLISIGTPLVADPEWPRKAQAGSLEDIRLCTGCCSCWSDLAGRHRPIGCAVNARAGMETVYAAAPATRPKHVVVLGGGPAGMEAARVAASRGHRVTLFERETRLGGQLVVAALLPHHGEWRTFTTYLETQLRKLRVDVRLGAAATAGDVLREKPDAVIVATGAQTARPMTPGIDLPHVAACVEVLTGKRAAGARVVILGGCHGGETAEFLAARGRQVTLVEAHDEVALDVDVWNRWALLDRLAGLNVRTLVNATVEQILPDGVRVAVQGRPPEFVPADTVVYAIGAQACDPLKDELAGAVPDLRVVGDCDSPQRVRQAVDAGFRAGTAL